MTIHQLHASMSEDDIVRWRAFYAYRGAMRAKERAKAASASKLRARRPRRG
jgi:hypothetical protein